MTFKIATHNIMLKLFDIPLEKSRVIYSRSKMTIPNEIAHKDNFNKLKYVEFLELICRIALHKFGADKEGEHELTFTEEVIVIVEEIFQRLRQTLNHPDIHQQVEGSDDSDYDDAKEANNSSSRGTPINKTRVMNSNANSIDLSNEDLNEELI